MTTADSSETPVRLEGRYGAVVVCWFLGLGSLVAWNSMLTIGYYYYALFPKRTRPTTRNAVVKTHDSSKEAAESPATEEPKPASNVAAQKQKIAKSGSPGPSKVTLVKVNKSVLPEIC